MNSSISTESKSKMRRTKQERKNPRKWFSFQNCSFTLQILATQVYQMQLFVYSAKVKGLNGFYDALQ